MIDKFLQLKFDVVINLVLTHLAQKKDISIGWVRLSAVRLYHCDKRRQNVICETE